MLSDQPHEPSADQPSSLAGRFLISAVQMRDPNFRQAVILIIAHDAGGAFGLIVNRPTDFTFGQVMQEQGTIQGAPAGMKIYFGGPVQSNHLFGLYSGLPSAVQSEVSTAPLSNVVFDPVLPSLVDYLHTEWAELSDNTRPPIRLYAGYAGWGEGQLEQELAEKTWIVRPAAAKHIFHTDPKQSWRETLVEMGGLYRLMAMSEVDPSLN